MVGHCAMVFIEIPLVWLLTRSHRDPNDKGCTFDAGVWMQAHLVRPGHRTGEPTFAAMQRMYTVNCNAVDFTP